MDTFKPSRVSTHPRNKKPNAGFVAVPTIFKNIADTRTTNATIAVKRVICQPYV